MNLQVFEICSIVIVLSALFGYINVKVLKLPNTIGLMIVAICFTGFLFASKMYTNVFIDFAENLITQVDFPKVLLEIMLGFLLFAGAMHTNFDQLRVQRWPVIVFSTLGVLASTFICAILTFFIFGAIGIQTEFIHCLLFGALISPTDPIAVLGILKQAGVPKKLETKIVGESLFNDGVGVVVFLTIFGIATGGSHPGEHGAEHGAVLARNSAAVVTQVAFNQEENVTSETAQATPVAEPSTHVTDILSESADAEPMSTQVFDVVKLFGQEVLGGILLGLVLGYVTFLLLRSIDDYEIEVLITLACVMGGYSLAMAWHLSAPLAIVVAGLIVGNDTVRGTAMSKQTEMYVNRFWELLDILLNAVLFVLIGLELLVLNITQEYLIAACIAIVIVLVSRFLSLLIPVRCFAKKLDFVPHTTTIMTWGGLRGGISIALALTLTADLNRELFLTVTYGVVIFSIIVQGLTVGKLAKKLIGAEAMEQPTTDH
ncbi:MAG: CPA1 family monovalent cation:H+ antiporter [Mariniblastus sp.]|jgi:CPA1 family monovalent cation:H+ antiporter